jgi:ribonuclease III family protein
MERFLQDSCDPKQLSPLTLAFLGDAVFEVLVREKIVCQGSRPVSQLHRLSVRDVCCKAQAAAGKAILPELTEEEAAVYRRGKNAHPGHVPQNADQTDYHEATALEALFGYLYLCGKIDRLTYLFETIQTFQHKTENDKGT